MKMQPSHRLFCPHPWPRPRLPFPQPAPTGRSLFGPRPEAVPARNPDGRLKGGMPPFTLLWDGPRGWASLSRKDGDGPDGYNLRLGPRDTQSARKGSGGGGVGLRLPSGRRRKHPSLCHRDPCPPAATELPVTFPPNALPIQTHTNTPIPCAAASRGGDLGGGIGLGDKGAGFPFRPEVVLRGNSSHPQAPETPMGRVSSIL